MLTPSDSIPPASETLLAFNFKLTKWDVPPEECEKAFNVICNSIFEAFEHQKINLNKRVTFNIVKDDIKTSEEPSLEERAPIVNPIPL